MTSFKYHLHVTLFTPWYQNDAVTQDNTVLTVMVFGDGRCVLNKALWNRHGTVTVENVEPNQCLVCTFGSFLVRFVYINDKS